MPSDRERQLARKQLVSIDDSLEVTTNRLVAFTRQLHAATKALDVWAEEVDKEDHGAKHAH